ncbi:hypothetical protein LDVICp201 [lymphocystis disease virus-China]|uniref:Fibronectin type-III domain-containing protein n=1 Tax=lymphocystis disease virus-China TaxID=256729 RepID=Q677R3_9VIRU|nr:hypothetical protein LDVICp201 [lymphocystis disease virus-China]AAU11044.1 hypothetical protein [lymphocystis disease virus-China]
MSKIVYILLIMYSISIIYIEAIKLTNLNPFNWQVNLSVAENCSVIYKTSEGESTNPIVSLYNDDKQIEIKKICVNKNESIFIDVPHTPQIVESVGCFILSGNNGYCIWSVVKDVKNLTFSYAFDTNLTLIPCLTYFNEFECQLKAFTSQYIYILFSGTLYGKTAFTVFKTVFKARLPPIEWTIIKNATSFNLRWTPPALKSLNEWVFIIQYSECGRTKTEIVQGKTSFIIDRISCCHYCLSIMAETAVDDRTSWSNEKCFNPNINVLTVIGFLVAVLILVISIVLIYFLMRKNKNLNKNNKNPYEDESEF